MGWPGPMTHRQFQAWQSWWEIHREVPSKSDWYIIQLTDVVRGILGKQQALEKYILKWNSSGPMTDEQRRRAREHADVQAKMRWSMWLGTNLLETKNGATSKG
jgi:hypothetical protein